jgi:hypothetical protein
MMDDMIESCSPQWHYFDHFLENIELFVSGVYSILYLLQYIVPANRRVTIERERAP